METKTRKLGEFCFWIALLIELVIVIVDKSAYINPYESQLFRITFLLFGIKVITTKYSGKEWACIFVVGLLAACSYFVNEKDEVVRAAVFVVSCKNISLKKNIKVIFYVTLIGCITLIILSVTGLYGAVSVTADYGRNGIETRYTLGMGHPNALHCMIWMVITLAMYLYVDSMKWYHFMILMGINIVTYLLTNSNTGILLATATILGVGILRYVSYLQKASWVYWAGAFVVVACIAFSVLGAYMGNGWNDSSTFMYKLDKILNGRYEYCYKVEAARLSNWKIFAAPENQEYFDAGFVRAFYWYGIVPGFMYVLMHLYLIWQSWKHKDYVLLVMVVAFSIYNLMEAHFISVYLLRNYLLVCMGYYWYQPFAERKETEGYFWQVPRLLLNRE